MPAKGEKSVCNGCIYAEWDLNKNGRKTGDGDCTFKYEPAPLPRAFYWWMGRGQYPGQSRIHTRIQEFETTKPNECPVKRTRRPRATDY